MATLMKTTWQTVSPTEAAGHLRTDLTLGLPATEVQKRQQELGRNELPETPPPSFWSMLVDQFKEVLVLILIGAAVISGFLGEWSDATVILLIVILNAVLGVMQQNKAEKSLAALKKLSKPLAVVIRDGKPTRIPAADLVPGDLVLIEAGDFVPADLRLVETATLKIEEAVLTGESVPVEKHPEVLEDGNLPLGDQKNMAFMGTVVTYGRGRGLVTATGIDTQMGRIAEMIQSAPAEETPLQRRLEELGKWLGGAAIVLVFLVFLTGIYHDLPVLEMFMTAISLAVAAIPEGLPAIVTIVLALGMQRMIRRNAIIRKLPAVETLGTTTVICSDKTGTLTQNQMTVRRIYTADGEEFYVSGQGYDPAGDFHRFTGDKLRKETQTPPVDPADSSSLLLLLAAGALANDAKLEKTETGFRVIGDPTEGALVVAAEKAGLSMDGLRRLYPRVAELPFDSERKLMTTFHVPSKNVNRKELTGVLSDLAQQAAVVENTPVFSFTKGAPDVLLSRCNRVLVNGEVRPLDDATRASLLAVNGHLAEEALRVLATGYREWQTVPEKPTSEAAETGLIFLGYSGMIDPPRPEARDAVAESLNAGIRTIMITGDHKATALAIAKDLGIAKEGDQAVTGPELEAMSDQELAAVVTRVPVYARVSPEHKMRIIAALKTHSHVVAMTGDGVNDAPALKRADIGVAMGITGTEVAKEASDMVLADDNFASIVSAVREGRTIYANIQKSIHYLLSCNTGEITSIFLSIVLNLGAPLTAIQILWTNLVTDGLPALALGMEPEEPGVMRRKPRKPKEGIFANGLGTEILLQGILIGGLTFGGYYWALQEAHAVETARTIAFMILSISQLFHAFNTRSREESLITIGPFRNRHMVIAFVSSLAMQLAVLYITPLNPVFNVKPLTLTEWEIVASLAFFPIPFVELTKYLTRVWRKRTEV